MTHWKHLVVALVAALALSACSSSSDNGGTASTETPPPAETGPTQEELDAETKRADDAEADAASEKERADELQAAADRKQAAEDLATARAMFSALRLSTAVLPGRPTTSITIADADSSVDRDGDGTPGNDEIVIPAMGNSNKATDANGNMFEVNIGTTKGSNVMESFAEKYADANSVPDGTNPIQYGADRTATLFSGTGNAHPLAASPSFPSKTGVIDYPAGEKRQFSGTYDGASGMFVCESATACSARYTAGGVSLTGTWTFVHAPGARTSTEDGSFLSYGWWLQKDSDGDIADVGPVFYLTGGTDLDTAAFPLLEGTATYEGSAAGKYAIYSGAFSDRSEAGHFTADAELTANFGASDANGSIKGTIDNFMTDAGSKDDWTVHLGTALLNDTTLGAVGDQDTNADGTQLGTATWEIGGVRSDTPGEYFARLFDQGSDTVPKEVGGYFDARFEEGVGEMVGAFAATRTTGE